MSPQMRTSDEYSFQSVASQQSAPRWRGQNSRVVEGWFNSAPGPSGYIQEGCSRGIPSAAFVITKCSYHRRELVHPPLPHTSFLTLQAGKE